jgi:hypothetical protein
MNRTIESHWIEPILIKISVTERNEYNQRYNIHVKYPTNNVTIIINFLVLIKND